MSLHWFHPSMCRCAYLASTDNLSCYLEFYCCSISGNVFFDPNKNGIEDTGESDYPATPSISITSNGETVTEINNGSYTITNLNPGTYTVTYGGLPTGYYMTSPLTGPPSSFSITVGSAGCSTNGAPGALCTNGDITNLNFGISNTHPWFQSNCGDMRNDNGIIDDLPAGQYGLITTAGCNSPGIDLSTVCNLTNCTLPTTLAHGIYITTGAVNNGNVTLNAYTFPAKQNYIFLINGSLTLQGNIAIPVGSTALFSTAEAITITPTVGAATLTTATSDLDGWYVAGQSFILPNAGNCNDLRLNIAGTVVVNALEAEGTFENNRDLCGNDTTYPTVSFMQRLDLLLNAPQFIENQIT